MRCKITEQRCAPDDLAGSGIAYLLWGLPGLGLAAGLFWPAARVWLWAPALFVAGIACVINAARCGRVHCYLTGPLFLVAAGATVLRGFGIIEISWAWIGWSVLVGTVLAHVPEWIATKYYRLPMKRGDS